MSHGDIITKSTQLFCKGKQTTEVKIFYVELNSQHSMYKWENLKKEKTAIT